MPSRIDWSRVLLGAVGGAVAERVAGPGGAVMAAGALGLLGHATEAAGVLLGGVAAQSMASPSPTPVPPGTGMTLWTGSTLREAWEHQRDAVIAARPNILVPYTGLGGGAGLDVIMAQARAAIPDLRLWIELSVDYVTDTTGQQAVETAHRLTEQHGAEAVLWNAERPYYANHDWGLRTSVQIVQGWKRVSRLPQGHTYGDPMGSSGRRSYPWTQWVGPGACDFEILQTYPFGDERRSGTAPSGALEREVTRSLSSWQRAHAAGWVADDLPVGLYLPGAYVSTEDTVTAAGATPWQLFWPWHGVYDAQTLYAILQLRK